MQAERKEKGRKLRGGSQRSYNERELGTDTAGLISVAKAAGKTGLINTIAVDKNVGANNVILRIRMPGTKVEWKRENCGNSSYSEWERQNRNQYLSSSYARNVPYTSSNKSRKRVKTTSFDILSFEKISSSRARSNAVLPSRSYCWASFSLFSSITLRVRYRTRGVEQNEVGRLKSNMSNNEIEKCKNRNMTYDSARKTVKEFLVG